MFYPRGAVDKRSDGNASDDSQSDSPDWHRFPRTTYDLDTIIQHERAASINSTMFWHLQRDEYKCYQFVMGMLRSTQFIRGYVGLTASPAWRMYQGKDGMPGHRENWSRMFVIFAGDGDECATVERFVICALRAIAIELTMVNVFREAHKR